MILFIMKPLNWKMVYYWDFDKNDVPVSLEIMDASKRFNIPKIFIK